MEKENYCSFEDFKSLQKKSFRNIPRALLKEVLQKLPDYASVVYLSLYDLCQINIKYPGSVVMSYSALGKELNKSESSIKRAVNILRKEGYLQIVHQGANNKQYLPNIIHVRCPKAIADKILKEEPDRKLAQVYQLPSKNTSQQEVSRESQFSSRSKGVDNFENLRRLVGLNLKGEGGKNELHKINNRDQQDLKLTIEARNVDNLSLWAQTVVNFEKINSTVVSSLSESENITLIKKIRAMHKSREIHHNYLNIGLDQLMSEIKYHVVRRNQNKTPTFKHALNAAAAMLRRGTWQTPRQLARLNSLRLEEEARIRKKAEIQGASEAFKNLMARISQE